MTVVSARSPDGSLQEARADKCTHLYVRARLLYGAQPLVPHARAGGVQRTESVPLAHTAAWNATCTFDSLVRDMPREASLELQLCAVGYTNNVYVIATVCVTPFNFERVLRRGDAHLLMWPGTVGAACCVDNPGAASTAVLLHVNFPSFRERDVVWEAPAPTAAVVPVTPRASVHSRLTALLSRSAAQPLTPAERRVVWQWRRSCTRGAANLRAVVLSAPIQDVLAPTAVAELHTLVAAWAPPCEPLDVVALLDGAIVDSAVRLWAVRHLDAASDATLLLVLPQLVQALKHELFHDSPLARLVLRRAATNAALAQRLYWLAALEMHQQPHCAQRFGVLLEALFRDRWQLRADIDAQRELVLALTDIANDLKARSRFSRLATMRSRLRDLSQRLLERGVTSPLDPAYDARARRTLRLASSHAPCGSVTWLRVRIEHCKYMQSKKMPLWLVFDAVNGADGRRAEQTVIFKTGDDLRQDMLAVQMLRLMAAWWRAAKLDMQFTTYECLATGTSDAGFIEVVTPATTTANITAEHGGATAAFRSTPLLRWLEAAAHTAAQPLARVVDVFSRSCAAYCVATYVLGIGDRHNDNVMLQPSGRLFHIDFGHILGHFK